jgi:hypothetical protein
METKKQLYGATNLILRIWKQQRWTNYNEIEPTGKEKAKGIFKVIKYTMPNNFVYCFELKKQEYDFWRQIKPSFRLGK